MKKVALPFNGGRPYNATPFSNFRSMYVDPLRVEIMSDSGGERRTLQDDLLPLDGAETYTLGLEDIFTIFFFFLNVKNIAF